MAIIAEFIELATGLPQRSLDAELISGIAEVQVASFDVELQGLIFRSIDLPLTLNNQETQTSDALFAPVDLEFVSNSIPLSLATEIQNNVVRPRDVYAFVETFDVPELAYPMTFNSLSVDKLIGADVSKVVFTGLLTPPGTGGQSSQTTVSRKEYWL